jgi:hypothetical protein
VCIIANLPVSATTRSSVVHLLQQQFVELLLQNLQHRLCSNPAVYAKGCCFCHMLFELLNPWVGEVRVSHPDQIKVPTTCCPIPFPSPGIHQLPTTAKGNSRDRKFVTTNREWLSIWQAAAIYNLCPRPIGRVVEFYCSRSKIAM